jgi:hypothetical protein
MVKLWCIPLVLTLTGCVVNDEYQAPVYYAPAPAASGCYAPPPPSPCSTGYRSSSPMYASPSSFGQTQEPPR